MSRSASKPAIPPVFALWNPESPRAVLFSKATRELCGSPPLALPWFDLLRGAALPLLPKGTVVRIDSPGKNWAVEKALLAEGAARMESEQGERLTRNEIANLPDDVGRILSSRQWYLGLCRHLEIVRQHVESTTPGGTWMLHPEDIAVMCNKAACQERLQSAGVRIPPLLGIVSGFDELVARMDSAGRNRVFLKLCHGSSASGSVALGTLLRENPGLFIGKGDRHESGVVLHNRRPITRYSDLREIRQLIDAVCRHRAQAEAWIPKAGWNRRRFDVRAVVIARRVRHVVARLANGPFTNLQFGAKRAGAPALREHLGADAFEAMCREAERAMACFPRSLYGGVDILLEPGRFRPRILEVNAFGDLLPAALHEGRDTYTWELEALAAADDPTANQVSATGT